MSETLYDSVTAANIPANATEVAGYVDGRYKWTDADWARFPHATLKLKISAIPFDFAADVCDCETGDYTPGQAAEWAVQRKARGFRPIIYCSVSVKASAVEQLNARGLKDTDVDWWEAHYTGQPHLEPGSEATQYADPGPYDLSETAPGWTADQTPPPSQNQSFQVGDKVRHDITVTTDGDGNGWAETTIPWTDFQAVSIQGPYPPVDGYWTGTAKAQDRDNCVCVVVEGCPKDSSVTVFVLAAN